MGLPFGVAVVIYPIMMGWVSKDQPRFYYEPVYCVAVTRTRNLWLQLRALMVCHIYGMIPLYPDLFTISARFVMQH